METTYSQNNKQSVISWNHIKRKGILVEKFGTLKAISSVKENNTKSSLNL